MGRTGRLAPTAALALLLTLAPWCATAAVDDNAAAALLSKHKAYVGWELGDASVKTLRVSETVGPIGSDGKVKPTFRVDRIAVGLAYKTTTTDLESGAASALGFTGSDFWYANKNGFTVPVLGDVREEFLARAVLFNEGTTKMSAVVQRKDDVDGTPAVVLRETPPQGKPFDLYIDPATGAYLRFVYDPGGDASTIDIDAYADLGTAGKIISAWHAQGSLLHHLVSTAKANDAITREQLQPPQQHSRWTFGSGTAFPIDLTTNRIYVKAVVNGVEGRFIFDTGATGIVLTDQFAKRTKVRRVAATEFAGIGGAAKGLLAAADTIAFADGSTLHDVAVTAGINLWREGVDGLLGFDFLAGAVVDLDLEQRRMTLYDPKTSSASESAGVVAVADLSTGVPLIGVRLNGTTDARALIDSGSFDAILVSAQFSEKLNVLAINRRNISGVGGTETMHCGNLENIEIGPLTYQNPGMCYTRSLEGDEVLLGMDLLKNFNVTFDYPDGKIVLQPRKSP